MKDRKINLKNSKCLNGLYNKADKTKKSDEIRRVPNEIIHVE